MKALAGYQWSEIWLIITDYWILTYWVTLYSSTKRLLLEKPGRQWRTCDSVSACLRERESEREREIGLNIWVTAVLTAYDCMWWRILQWAVFQGYQAAAGRPSSGERDDTGLQSALYCTYCGSALGRELEQQVHRPGHTPLWLSPSDKELQDSPLQAHIGI